MPEKFRFETIAEAEEWRKKHYPNGGGLYQEDRIWLGEVRESWEWYQKEIDTYNKQLKKDTIMAQEQFPGWWTILADESGGLSSMRVAFLLTIVMVLAGWGYTTFIKKELQPLPDNITTLVIGLGAVKAVQRFGEKPSDSTTTTTTTT